MKVLLVNGSPNGHGCTFTALSEAAGALRAEGIDTEIFQLGKKPIAGCIACGKCRELGRCVFDDRVTEFSELAGTADGFIFGSPVYYAGMNGSLKSFMDRLFYSGGGRFAFKPAAAVVSARRAGTTAALEQINKYFQLSQMPVISSCYWNMVHGSTPEQVREDAEGLQIMRTLGRNMAWFLKLKEAGERDGIMPPEQEGRIFTNFIR